MHYDVVCYIACTLCTYSDTYILALYIFFFCNKSMMVNHSISHFIHNQKDSSAPRDQLKQACIALLSQIMSHSLPALRQSSQQVNERRQTFYSLCNSRQELEGGLIHNIMYVSDGKEVLKNTNWDVVVVLTDRLSKRLN